MFICLYDISYFWGHVQICHIFMYMWKLSDSVSTEKNAEL